MLLRRGPPTHPMLRGTSRCGAGRPADSADEPVAGRCPLRHHPYRPGSAVRSERAGTPVVHILWLRPVVPSFIRPSAALPDPAVGNQAVRLSCHAGEHLDARSVKREDLISADGGLPGEVGLRVLNTGPYRSTCTLCCRPDARAGFALPAEFQRNSALITCRPASALLRQSGPEQDPATASIAFAITEGAQLPGGCAP